MIKNASHISAQAQHQVESRLLLDVVVRKSAAVLQLLACKDQALLIRRDALLVLDLRLHVVDGVASLDIQGDGLASQGLHKDLHGCQIRISHQENSWHVLFSEPWLRRACLGLTKGGVIMQTLKFNVW